MSDDAFEPHAWLGDHTFSPAEISSATPSVVYTGASGVYTPYNPAWNTTLAHRGTTLYQCGPGDVTQSSQSTQPLYPSGQSPYLQTPQGSTSNTNLHIPLNHFLTPQTSTARVAAVSHDPGPSCQSDLSRPPSNEVTTHDLKVPHNPSSSRNPIFLQPIQPRPTSLYSQPGGPVNAQNSPQSSYVSPFLNGLGISAAPIDSLSGVQFMAINMTRIDPSDDRLKSFPSVEVPTLAFRMKKCFSVPQVDLKTSRPSQECEAKKVEIIEGSDAVEIGDEILRCAAVGYDYRPPRSNYNHQPRSAIGESVCGWEKLDWPTRCFLETMKPIVEAKTGWSCRKVYPRQWHSLEKGNLIFDPTERLEDIEKDQKDVELVRTYIEETVPGGESNGLLRQPHSCRVVFEQPDKTLRLLIPSLHDLGSGEDTTPASHSVPTGGAPSSRGKRVCPTGDEGRVVPPPSRSPFREACRPSGVTVCSEAQTNLSGIGLAGHRYTAPPSFLGESCIQPSLLILNPSGLSPASARDTEEEELGSGFVATTQSVAGIASGDKGPDEPGGSACDGNSLQTPGAAEEHDMTLEQIEELLASVQ